MKKYLLLLFTFFLFVFSSKAEFGIFASAVYINVNGSSQFYNTQLNGINSIGTVDFGGNLGSFTANTGTLSLRGAEIKTFKDPGSNVCGGTLYYTVYPKGNRPVSPTFTAIGLGFYCDCNGDGTFNSCGGGTCTIGRDQKWQKVNDSKDLTQLSAGDYTLELYYQIPGSSSSSSECGEFRFDSNLGNNYTADFTILQNLAVNFSGLSGLANNNGILLKWSIENDVDIIRYEIERSANGIDFSTLGAVSSAKSRLPYNYSMMDKNPLSGNGFYRIKFYELDNSISYSNVYRMTWNVSGNDLQVIFNQSSSALTIRSGIVPKGKYQLNIINYIGQQVLSSPVNYNGTENSITIDFPKKLSAGAYKILLLNNELSYKGSFLVR
ncbi:hypothetical protein LK994_09745 [Ferruginibacter lapsinanis]|uniref:hypothetical protein n=1 Tax=Ferruginibacter lapsinanis TaxID=563172 RepID=UPI001E4A82AF|nr:hypothetical protein [Ferruginibacter lapsinanis]UEG48919.1 hypothetical protein LK994_09745 [Ferruginibacter lapsinanis]